MPTPDPTPTPEATYDLFPKVYDELKRLARRHRRDADEGNSICTTELVHEAWLKLNRNRDDGWEGRAHFFGAASNAMRQVLVDFARRRQADKRGGDQAHVSLSEASAMISVDVDEILALDAALDKLDAVDTRLRKIVELRFFAGVPEDEVAAMLGLSVRTVGRDWLKARMFLLRELGTSDS